MIWKSKKCIGSRKLNRFLSYDGITKMKIHVVCYDTGIHHYELFPCITLIPSLGRKEIGYRLKFTGLLGLLLLLLLFVVAIVAIKMKSFLLLIIGVALLVMALYTILQLHFIDLKLVRVFEVAFANETYWNLKNMDLNNPSNRVHEIHAFPEEEEVRCLPFRLPIITKFVSFCLYIIRLVKHDIAIQKYLKHCYLSVNDAKPVRLRDEIAKRMESVFKSIIQLDLKILDMVVVQDKEVIQRKKLKILNI